jgi:hypothetical protein
MTLQLHTPGIEIYISELSNYLGVHESVDIDKKIARRRYLDWEMTVSSACQSQIDSIKFKGKRLRFDMMWEISLDQLEEYEALRLQKQHNAFIGKNSVYGQIILDTDNADWKMDFSCDLIAANSFSCKPESVWVYLDSNYIEISCKD